MIVAYTIIVVYSLALILIFMYALAQLNLLFNYRSAQKKEDTSPKFDFTNSKEIPRVTIQLPVYNEIYVMERLLDNIVTLEYPGDKLEIQVLDDSTDESIVTTEKHIKRLQKRGINIQHVHRTDRTGYKAGALDAAMDQVEGDFIAGDAVELVGPDGAVIARGLVAFDSEDLPQMLGRSTKELAASLGAEYERELVHRDDLVLI